MVNTVLRPMQDLVLHAMYRVYGVERIAEYSRSKCANGWDLPSRELGSWQKRGWEIGRQRCGKMATKGPSKMGIRSEFVQLGKGKTRRGDGWQVGKNGVELGTEAPSSGAKSRKWERTLLLG